MRLIQKHKDGNLIFCKKSLKRNNLNINDKEYGTNPLLYSCSYNNHNSLEIVRELLKCPGIDVNVKHGGDPKYAYMNKYIDGNTPLIFACSLNHYKNPDNVEIVKELLKHPGIDVNAKSNNGTTALINACRNCDYYIYKYDVQKNALEIVKELLKCKDINYNDKDDTGMTALMYAYKNNSTKIIKELYKYIISIENCPLSMDIVRHIVMNYL